MMERWKHKRIIQMEAVSGGREIALLMEESSRTLCKFRDKSLLITVVI